MTSCSDSILVVEDNVELSLFIRDALVAEFETVAAYDGRQAIRLALQAPPLLVLVDVAIPAPGGIELIRELAAHPELASIPVIALSPRADDIVRVRMLREGAADWLVRPFSADELQARVRNLVHARALEAANRRLRAELDRHRADVTRAARGRSQFLARLVADLREPLDRLVSRAAAIVGDDTEVGDCAGRLSALLGDVAEFASLESGAARPELAATDLDALLARVVADARAQALGRDVAVGHIAPPFPLGRIRADRELLLRALGHLLGNALRFTPAGGQVTLHAERVDRAHAAAALPGFDFGHRLPLPPGGEADFVAISVYDSGIGIAAADLDRLFAPLSRLDDGASAARRAGRGLGLAVVREIAQLHGGTVAVTSDAGVGSCFTIWLPMRLESAVRRRVLPAGDPTEAPVALVVTPDPHAAESLDASLRADGFEVRQVDDEGEVRAIASECQPELTVIVPRGAGAFVPGTRVLVIDHDAVALERVAGDLRQSGYTAMRAHGGREGIEIAARFRPDMILLAARMPDVDGFGVAASLRRDPANARIPIIVVGAPPPAPASPRRAAATKNPDRGRFVGDVRRALQARGLPA